MSSGDDPGLWVTIGPREIYDAVTGVSTKVDRDSAKLDLLTAEVRAQGQSLQDHERRIRAVERSRWPLPSLAVVVSIAALLASIITSH